MTAKIIMSLILGLPGLIAFVYGLVGIIKDKYGAGKVTGFGASLILFSLFIADIIPL